MAETPEKADDSLLPELLRLPRLRLACFPLLLPLNLTLPLRLRLLQYNMKKTYQPESTVIFCDIIRPKKIKIY